MRHVNSKQRALNKCSPINTLNKYKIYHWNSEKKLAASSTMLLLVTASDKPEQIIVHWNPAKASSHQKGSSRKSSVILLSQIYDYKKSIK